MARRAYSRGELQDKLMEYAEKAQVEMALDRLESLNLLNDADYAYNFALYRIRRHGWGASKVIDSLLKRRVDKDVIESAMVRIRNEGIQEISLQTQIEKYCRKKGQPASSKDIEKMISHLRRCGFEEEDITYALKEALSNSVSFETGE